jgi:hypothetical protein
LLLSKVKKIRRYQNKLLSCKKSSFVARNAWRKLVKYSLDRADLFETVIRQVAVDELNPFRLEAQDEISKAWWNSCGSVAEDKMMAILLDTASVAKHGTLRIITHLVHGSLTEYSQAVAESGSGSGSQESAIQTQFFADLDKILKVNDYWSFELLGVIGDIFKNNLNLRDSTANLVWSAWLADHELADKIADICRENQILPADGMHLFIGAAVIGSKELKRVTTEKNVEELIKCLLPRLDLDLRIASSFRYLLTSANGKVLDQLWTHIEVGGNPQFAELLSSNSHAPSGEIIDLLWRRWAKDENVFLQSALIRWSVPFSRKSLNSQFYVSDDLLTQTNIHQLLVESHAVVGTTKGLITGDLPADVASFMALFRTIKKSVIPKIGALVHRSEVLAIREELCRRILSGEMDSIDTFSYCKEYKIAPADEVQRSVFFLLTDQVDELSLSDPELDGLGVGYLSAGEQLRDRIRAALLRQPNLDLGQVLASFNRRDRLSRMSVAELDYFVEQLLNRKEFDGLLEIGVNMSLALFLYVCTKISSIDPDWFPQNTDLAELFQEFRKTRIAEILKSGPSLMSQSNLLAFLNSGGETFGDNWWPGGRQNQTGSWPIGSVRTRIRFHGRINDLSFSPDGKFLAVAGSNNVVGEVDLILGRLVFLERRLNSSVGSISHIGSHRIIAAERTNSVTKTCRVVCINNGRTISNVVSAPGSITSLVNFGDDHLMFTGRDGTVGVVELGSDVALQSSSKFGPEFPRLATEKSDARGNVIFTDAAIYVSKNSRKLSFGTQLFLPNRVKRATWISDNRIVYLDFAGKIGFLDVDHIRQTVSMVRGGGLSYSAKDLVLLPNRHQIAVLNSVKLTLMNLGDLGQVGSLAIGGTSVHGSPDGDLIAVGDESGLLKLIDTSISAVPALFGKPIVSCTPRDFQMCNRAHQSFFERAIPPDREKTMREIMDLLLMLLRFKFRFDISIAEASNIKGGDYDIQLN